MKKYVIPTAGDDEKLARVLTNDPGTGVMRHADAGYPEAIATARQHGIRIPMLDSEPSGNEGGQ